MRAQAGTTEFGRERARRRLKDGGKPNEPVDWHRQRVADVKPKVDGPDLVLDRGVCSGRSHRQKQQGGGRHGPRHPSGRGLATRPRTKG